MPAVANGARFSHLTFGPATFYIEIFRDERSLGAIALSESDALDLAKKIREAASLVER
jgi:hypothetical protein